jgi:hypothetical protein
LTERPEDPEYAKKLLHREVAFCISRFLSGQEAGRAPETKMSRLILYFSRLALSLQGYIAK